MRKPTIGTPIYPRDTTSLQKALRGIPAPRKLTIREGYSYVVKTALHGRPQALHVGQVMGPATGHQRWLVRIMLDGVPVHRVVRESSILRRADPMPGRLAKQARLARLKCLPVFA